MKNFQKGEKGKEIKKIRKWMESNREGVQARRALE